MLVICFVVLTGISKTPISGILFSTYKTTKPKFKRLSGTWIPDCWLYFWQQEFICNWQLANWKCGNLQATAAAATDIQIDPTRRRIFFQYGLRPLAVFPTGVLHAFHELSKAIFEEGEVAYFVILCYYLSVFQKHVHDSKVILYSVLSPIAAKNRLL